jgi:hypothetical protein
MIRQAATMGSFRKTNRYSIVQPIAGDRNSY